MKGDRKSSEPLKFGRAWTAAQWAGISTTGHSLLVSAAAGSGKTSVLAERCVHLVCDAPNPCNVDDLLVVTFTEAAAAEMKGRIVNALRDRAAQAPSDRLNRQLALIDQAQVSTLHAFCARLLRQHFNLVGLDPGFTVLDGDEARLLRREIARELFDDRYELDTEGDFHRLIDAYGEGEDDRVLRKVLHVHELLTSVVDRQGWLKGAHDRIIESARSPLEQSDMGRALATIIRRGLSGLRRRCADAMRRVERDGFPLYAKYLAEVGATLRYWDETFASDGIDALAEVAKDPSWPRLPTVRGDADAREAAKAIVESVRKEAKSGCWRDILNFSTQQWQDGLELVLPHAKVFLGLVAEFTDRYGNAKRASRCVDFADLERLALQALCEGARPTPCARSYHNRFAHVLVDEYQDINEVQDAILALLSKECLAIGGGAESNLFCVGDVKQSIYRFRLADPRQFLERQDAFRHAASHGKVIDLQANFRSRPALLKAINQVFSRLMTADAVDIEYDQTHHLHAGADYPPDSGPLAFAGAPIELHLLPDKLDARDESDETAPPADCEEDEQDLDRTEREAVLVAREIRRIVGLEGQPARLVTEKDAGGAYRQRPATFRDIVVLLRSMKFKATQLAAVLGQYAIPVYTEARTGFFEANEVRDVLALLELLDNARQDIPLAAVLRSPLGKLPQAESDLARIRAAYPADTIPFHDAVSRYATEKGDALARHISEFFLRLNRLREAAQRQPLADVIWTLYQQSGYLAFVSALHNGEQRAANLLHLHERAAEFGSFQRQGLSRFLRFLEQLREESDLGQPSLVSQAQEVVRVMSIHASKGLEFPVVILPDLGKIINVQDCQGTILADRAAGLGMVAVDDARECRYPSLASMIVQGRLRQQSLAEELRVLYVAMTRAKEHLLLIGTCKESRPAEWEGRWRGHDGPLPADTMLGARTMLDWLGPVAVAAQGDVVPVLQTVWHPAAEVMAWPKGSVVRKRTTPEQNAMARLEPLAGDATPTEAAGRVIERVSFVYPFRAYSGVAAARAVTAQDFAGALHLPHDLAGSNGRQEQSLSVPRFLRDGDVVSAVERGSAMHLALQHLKFSGRCDASDVLRGIKSLVERHVLTEGQARLINHDAILWFLSTPLGLLLREHHAAIRREVSIHFAQEANVAGDAPPPDLLDRVMVRGRIDALVQLPQETLIVDYKTDGLLQTEVADRAGNYTTQIAAYSKAIARITGKIVSKGYLVFLTPRVIWPVRFDS